MFAFQRYEMCSREWSGDWESMSRRLWWVGALGGIAAGIGYLIAEQLLASVNGKPPDEPFRLFASIVLGAQGLGPAVSTRDALLVGSLFILIFSLVAGFGFAALADHFPGLAATAGTLILGGVTYGGGLWLLGFYVLGSFFWPWLTRTDPGIQLVSALLGFGALLGASFALAGVHRSPELE